MLKNIPYFISGAVLMSAVFLTTAIIFKDRIVNIYPGQNTKTPQVLMTSSPTSLPKAPPESPKVSESEKKQFVEKLRTSLYQEGINVKAKVDTVYPGVGFIIVDDVNTKLFTKWTQNPPTKGQTVSIKGTVQKVSANQGEFQKDSASNPDLGQFLKDQQIFIEAKEITPTS